MSTESATGTTTGTATATGASTAETATKETEINRQFDDSTIMGLSHWYRHIFEKYGWVKLAEFEGNPQIESKQKCYSDMIDRFIASCDKRIKKITNENDPHRQDLELMLHHVEVLKSKG